MRDQHILDIAEAYASVYAKPEQEVLSEEVEQLDEISRSMGRRATQYRKDQEQSAHMERVRQHQEKMKNDPEYRANHERLSRVHSKKEEQKESFDLFDYLLEYLVAEGYADTNKAALAIMANMSEEWKQSIVEEVFDEALTGERYKKAVKNPGGTAYSRMVSADPSKRATRGGRGGESDFGAGDRGSGNKAARRAGTYKED